MSPEYGIYNLIAEITLTTGFSREEAYAYIECEAVSGDTIIRKTEDGKGWYKIATGERI